MQLREEKDEIIVDYENNKALINEIRQKVNVMKKSKYRTSNFSLIEYFVNNNFQPLNLNYLISKLIEDYNSNPERYVLSDNKKIFKSEKTFKQSLIRLARYNNSFEIGPGDGELSLNLKNTLQYLRSVYKKYISNSRDVKTPIKISGNFKNNKKEIQNNNIKVKDNDDFDIEIINYKKDSFSQNEKNYNNYVNKRTKKLENEIVENNSAISLTDSNVSTIIKLEKNEQSKDRYKEIPKIFLKRMINKDNIIHFLEKSSISSMANFTQNYITSVDREINSEKIENKLDNICYNLRRLLPDKESYIKKCITLNASRKEIFQVWEIMNNQLKSINLQIKIKSYSYEMYVILINLIYAFEKNYKLILENIQKNLIELKDLEKSFQEKIANIRNSLATIKSRIKNDKKFDKLSELIQKNLRFDINNYYQLDDDQQLEDEETEEENYKSNEYNIISQEVRNYQEERKKIMEEIKKIDKTVGNITIY